MLIKIFLLLFSPLFANAQQQCFDNFQDKAPISYDNSNIDDLTNTVRHLCLLPDKNPSFGKICNCLVPKNPEQFVNQNKKEQLENYFKEVTVAYKKSLINTKYKDLEGQLKQTADFFKKNKLEAPKNCNNLPIPLFSQNESFSKPQTIEIQEIYESINSECTKLINLSTPIEVSETDYRKEKVPGSFIKEYYQQQKDSPATSISTCLISNIAKQIDNKTKKIATTTPFNDKYNISNLDLVTKFDWSFEDFNSILTDNINEAKPKESPRKTNYTKSFFPALEALEMRDYTQNPSFIYNRELQLTRSPSDNRNEQTKNVPKYLLKLQKIVHQSISKENDVQVKDSNDYDYGQKKKKQRKVITAKTVLGTEIHKGNPVVNDNVENELFDNKSGNLKNQIKRRSKSFFQQANNKIKSMFQPETKKIVSPPTSHPIYNTNKKITESNRIKKDTSKKKEKSLFSFPWWNNKEKKPKKEKVRKEAVKRVTESKRAQPERNAKKVLPRRKAPLSPTGTIKNNYKPSSSSVSTLPAQQPDDTVTKNRKLAEKRTEYLLWDEFKAQTPKQLSDYITPEGFIFVIKGKEILKFKIYRKDGEWVAERVED